MRGRLRDQMTANELAERFIAQAKAAKPAERNEIFRQAAYTFMGMAQNPKHARGAQRLTAIGLDFAGAASSKAETPHAGPVTMDDFTDLLQETSRSYDEVGDDPMDLIARRRQVHEDRTPVDPGRISIAPESFNKDVTLGRSAKVKFAPNEEDFKAGILNTQNVAFWQGIKKESQAMTCDANLGTLPPPPVAGEFFGPPNVRPFGEVEYGADGNRTKVRFDIAMGKRFTVVGNYISLSVGMRPPKVGADDQAILFLGGSIGAFAAPTVAPLVYTEFIDFLPIGQTSAFIPIPLKAAMLLPIQTALPLGDAVEIRFLDFGSALVSRNFYVQATNTVMDPIPITGDVAFIVVINNSTTTALDARLPFQLAM